MLCARSGEHLPPGGVVLTGALIGAGVGLIFAIVQAIKRNRDKSQ